MRTLSEEITRDHIERLRRASEELSDTLREVYDDPRTNFFIKAKLELCGSRATAILRGEPEPPPLDTIPAPPQFTDNVVPFKKPHPRPR
jgi:hypothetical protein